MSERTCDCAASFVATLGTTADYDRFKRTLNRGRHPAFIGRGTVDRNARGGGLIFITVGGEDAAVALVNPYNSTLLALNVAPGHRGHGLGGAALTYLRPNFARVIDDKVDWFVARGYVSVGEPKLGRSRFTQVMVRGELMGLAGRVAAQFPEAQCRCSSEAEAAAHGHGLDRDGVGEDPVPAAGHRPRRRRALHAVDEGDVPDDRAAGGTAKRDAQAG